MSSNHPELVALRECLETHRDSENLLYLTDSRTTLQAINRWIGGGAKILHGSSDQDKQKSLSVLQETENWVVWKTRDKTWTHTLKREGFHQLLSFHKDEKENVSGSRVKRW